MAAFEFSHTANSYASRTGRPAHVGVIGIALFREQTPAPARSVAPEPYSQREHRDNGMGEGDGGNRLGRLRDEPVPRSRPAPAPAPSNLAESLARSQAADSVAKPSAKLGTAHGQRETSVVTHTTFTRLQDRPNEVISIRYDSLDNLIARGVIREPIAGPQVPRAFPQSDRFSYVPDPR